MSLTKAQWLELKPTLLEEMKGVAERVDKTVQRASIPAGGWSLDSVETRAHYCDGEQLQLDLWEYPLVLLGLGYRHPGSFVPTPDLMGSAQVEYYNALTRMLARVAPDTFSVHEVMHGYKPKGDLVELRFATILYPPNRLA